jgi:putative spermidine/putrescine transport system ATP-binding protein
MSVLAVAPQAVRVHDVSVVYGTAPALRDLSIEARPGEMLALLGPSGCGKTTLLRAIAGFLAHTGEIYIGEARATHLPSHRRNLGMVFQDYALFPHMTVADNVGFGLRMRRVPRDDRAARVQEAIALVGLGEVGQRLPRQLSGGQQQRVALARALVIRPSVLLLDEPLSALDRKLREEMELELRLLQKRVGITTIFVTHDQEEALAISDRIAVMHEGRVLQVGTPEEIYDSPRHEFVSAFVGKANRLRAIVVGREDELLLCELSGGARLRLRGVAAVGAAIEFAVRPEKIVVAAPDAPLDNRAEGKITNRIYLGMYTELRVEIASGQELTVVCQNTQPAATATTLRPGQAVILGWNADAGHLLAQHSGCSRQPTCAAPSKRQSTA